MTKSKQLPEKLFVDKKGDAFECLTFALDGEEYAIETMSIQEITRMIEVTFVPGTPSYVKGIVPVRGTVMPVFDLHERLGLSPFKKSKLSRFVICQAEEGPLAIMVDQVNAVVQVKEAHVQSPPLGITLNGSGFVKGITSHKGRLLILVDFEKISSLQ